MGGYISGLIFGKIYLHMKSIDYKLGENKWFIFFWYAAIPIAFAVIMSADIFYKYDIQTVSIWTAVYFAITRNLYGILSAYVILGMSFKIGCMYSLFFR